MNLIKKVLCYRDEGKTQFSWKLHGGFRNWEGEWKKLSWLQSAGLEKPKVFWGMISLEVMRETWNYEEIWRAQ